MWDLLRTSQQTRKVAYKSTHSSDFSLVYDVFYMSMLKKYVFCPSHILSQRPKEVQEALTYEEKQVKIMDRVNKVLRFKVNVIWKNRR